MIYTYTVYALIDPREPDVYRYIGLTRCAPYARLRGHYGDLGAYLRGGAELSKKLAWLHKIRLEGSPAQVIPLEEIVGLEAAAAGEIRWIEKYRPDGMLTNGIHLAPYVEKTKRTCRQCGEVRPPEEFKNKCCAECNYLYYPTQEAA